MGLTLVALWFIGRDGPERMRYQIGMFTALTAMALSSLVCVRLQCAVLQASSVRRAGRGEPAVLPADGLVVSVEQRGGGVRDCGWGCGA